MSSGVVECLERAFAKAQSERQWFESNWDDVATHVAPLRAVRGNRSAGPQRQYDTTAALAAEHLAAGLYGMTTNPSTNWFAYSDPSANEEEAKWLTKATAQVRAALRSSQCGFYPAALEVFRDTVLFGTGLLGVEMTEDGLSTVAQQLGDRWLISNAEGGVDGLFRVLSFDARSLNQRWPDAGAASSAKADAPPTSVLHALMTPSAARRFGLPLDEAERRIVSLFIDRDKQRVLSQGWYREMPIVALRWSAVQGAGYGSSPTMAAMPDIKLLNTLTKAGVVATELAVDPPLLTVNENGLRGLKTHPGAIIYGGLDPSGRRLFEPLLTGQEPGSSQPLIASKQAQVREAFFHSLLQFSNESGVTATEFLGRFEEKVRLFAPYLARIQAELLEPLLHRALGLMVRSGQLSPPTARLRRALLASGRTSGLTIEITSPLAKAQRLSEATNLMRALEGVGAAQQMMPKLAERLNQGAIANRLLEALSLEHHQPEATDHVAV